MQVKTYQGKTPAHCLHQVKLELGSEAVILSSKTVTRNGRRMTEVMAAVEEPAARVRGEASPAGTPQSKDAFLSESLQASSALSHEWAQIKDCLMEFMRTKRDPARLSPTQRVAMEYLEREGVEEKVLVKVYADLAENPSRSVLPVLEALCRALPLERGSFEGKMHVFLGPSGAGKTSALIRWALREKKADPKARICVASADGGRGQGRLVLRHYAELGSLAFRELATPEDAALLVAESREFDLVLIDLPGLDAGETAAARLAELGLDGVSNLAAHLVLSPHYGSKQYDAYLAAYACDKLTSIIWTKLDEACTFGPMLNVACATGLPVSALSYGSGLRNTMVSARTEMVWRLLFKHQLPGESARQGA
ncbi:MAG: flagellar biosynthesis protein FlhF [Desulfovibrionaceae bacterium]